MNQQELQLLLSKGEDSLNQFKSISNNPEQLAAELVAFSNCAGGKLYIGVQDDGSIVGLSLQDVQRLNNMLSNVASQHVHPSINPLSENVHTDSGIVIVVTVSSGTSKPYTDNQGSIWVKSGGDKRKVTARKEIQRMFQSAGLVHADEVPVTGMTCSDVDVLYFSNFFEDIYGETVENQNISLEKLLENMNLVKNGMLNLAGALLFSRRSRYMLPSFIVKAVAYPGTDIDKEHYKDSRDFSGKLEEVFSGALSFIMNNIPYAQGNQNINSIAEPIVPQTVWEELLANALLHRDYFISSAIRIFLFKDRVEIISPGHLPNNLTIDNIKAGNSVIRNPILASFGTKILPYRGLGNGIRRALKIHEHIEFIDDRDGNQFIAIVRYLSS